jgi:hypothetical protein
VRSSARIGLKPKQRIMSPLLYRRQNRAKTPPKMINKPPLTLGLMDENGWTWAELARQLGVSRAWVTKVLRSGFPTSAALD